MNDANKYRDLSRYRRDYSSDRKDVFSGSKRNTQNSFTRSSNRTYSSQHGRKSEEIASSHSKNSQIYSREAGAKYSHSHIKKSNRVKRRKNFVITSLVVLVFGIIGIGAWKFWPINVSINGQEVTLNFDKTVEAAVEASNIKVSPGNFVAVDFSLLKKGEGNEYYAEVDGKEVNKNYTLHSNDEITYTNGKDIMEDYTSEDSDIKAKSKIIGNGSIHKFEGSGEPGTWSVMHGKVSGITTERQTKDPDNVVVRRVNINPGKDKVIALTFDDGPSEDHTQDVLDLLKEYDAHATFFVVGERLEEAWGRKLVAKEANAGHQVCTHTYDHARAAGGTDMTGMSAEKQIWEITEGKKMISRAIDGDVSSVVRVPGGNLNSVTSRLIAPFVSAEIGWNIDTGDWEMPGSEKIYKNMCLASSGDVILCHDGGGDRSETVEALKDFLKEYSLKGYKFITIDELMQYEEAKQNFDDDTLDQSNN